MASKSRLPLALALLTLPVVQPLTAEITDEQARNAIQRGVSFLKSQQKADGSWSEHPAQPGGMTSLCALALLQAGVEAKSAEIQRSLVYLRSLGPPDMVYSTALQTMVFCAAEPDKDRLLISRNVKWLEEVQIKQGPRKGGWTYSGGQGGGDNSNSQFAMLALHEAERAGVEVREQTWKLALDYWLDARKGDGSWGYFKGQPSTGSMTCAGIASVIIAAGRVNQGDAQVSDGRVQCCGRQTDHDDAEQAIEAGLQWLGSRFSVARHPSPLDLDKTWRYYYLYGVERIGRLTGRRFIGRHDWFREGAEILIEEHDDYRGLWAGKGYAENNPLVATSFALLFLSKGRRPVVISKLKHGEGNDWDLHRSAVANLTRRIEQRWRRELTWQTIDARAATVEDLMQTPVLFISGRNSLNLTQDQRENLRQYVNQGGFIFAEACCDGKGFDRDFRALVKELFPQGSLRLLPANHPIWYAEEKVDPTYMRALLGLEACCRTSVVYCPPAVDPGSRQDLSCYWELSRGNRETGYPQAVQDEIEACLRTGENVITYATNRELKNKLDRPQIASESTLQQPERGVLYIPKLLHSGGGDDAPSALPNLLNFVRAQAQLRIGVENRLIEATDVSLYEYPILFMHGIRDFRFSPDQRRALAWYVERGGVIFADAICASPEFTNAFRREMQAIFPDHRLARIPPEHPMFTSQFRGYDLAGVTLRDPQIRTGDDPLRASLSQISPLLERLEIDDRPAVIFSPYDISCALESGVSLQCKGYVKQDAAKIGLNVILFALQQ